MTLTRSVSYLFVSLTLALFAGQASALQADYVDIDPVFRMLSDGGSVSGNFNITMSNTDGGEDFSEFFLGADNAADVVGFDPATQNIASAEVNFLLMGLPDSAAEALVIDMTGLVGSETLTTQVYYVELVTLDVDVAVLAALNETGQLDWTITADPAVVGNNFMVVFANLEAYLDVAATGGTSGGTDTSGQPVPEPGSTALLAVGTLVIARASRSRRR